MVIGRYDGEDVAQLSIRKDANPRIGNVQTGQTLNFFVRDRLRAATNFRGIGFDEMYGAGYAGSIWAD